jgi:hypothetical protein
MSLARNVLNEQDLNRHRASDRLDQQARTSNKRTRFPKGHLYDQRYAQEHAVELAARKEEEKQARLNKRRSAQEKGKEKAPAPQEPCIAGPSTALPEGWVYPYM